MKRLLILLAVFAVPSAFGQTRIATLSQQKMCAEQAAKVFNAGFSHSMYAGYVNHYDAVTNVCYIMTSVTSTYDGTVYRLLDVSDAFEGQFYGTCTTNSREPIPLSGTCFIKPRGHVSIDAKTRYEYEKLVDKYFGIAN